MNTSRNGRARRETHSIDAVVPYWRNPRKISEEAIEKVMESITEFGYVQPIVVDTDQVIIIGHTRYQALRRLGYTQIDVLEVDLSPSEAKELRIIDNRSHEYTSWDYDKLEDELKDLADDEFTVTFFPDASPDDFEVEVDALDLNAAENDEHLVEFICPSCWHEWEMKVTREQILSGTLAVESEEV